jgi:hypothetical protein
MNTRHVPKMNRKAVERLLDGAAEHRPGKLTRMLAAARAPGRDDELAGEEMAVAAFEAAHLVPAGNPRTDQESKSMLGKLLTVKILATTLATVTTGGVALAAATGAFAGSSNAGTVVGAAPTVGVSQATSPANQPAATSAPRSASASTVDPSSTAQATETPARTLPDTATGLCRVVASDAMATTTSITTQTGLEQALSSSAVGSVLRSSEFAPLTAAVNGAANVPDYCALLLDLPRLPMPADLAKLPADVVAKLLPELPVPVLSAVLTQVPGSALAVVLPELPSATLSGILTELPTSVLGRVLTSLPTSALSSVLTELPSSVVSHLLDGLPSSVLSQLPSSVLSLLGLG